MTFESKFRNFVGRIEKLSKEEITIISRQLLELLNKEKKIKQREVYIENDNFEDENWDDINNQITRSNIKRYKWDKILGESLTKRILKLRNKGSTPEETFKVISIFKGVRDFLEDHPREEKNLLKNLRINVHARYGENKTSEKIKENTI